MELICAYCNKSLGQKEPLENKLKTHGICPACRDYFSRQEENRSFNDYLEIFDRPVMVVDGEGRVAAANEQVLKMLNKPADLVLGLLGGDAMDCAYSRLPEGCGETNHCSACTIRRIVQRTLEEQRPLYREPVKLIREDSTVDILISTRLIGRLIRIVIEELNIRS